MRCLNTRLRVPGDTGGENIDEKLRKSSDENGTKPLISSEKQKSFLLSGNSREGCSQNQAKFSFFNSGFLIIWFCRVF